MVIWFVIVLICYCLSVAVAVSPNLLLLLLWFHERQSCLFMDSIVSLISLLGGEMVVTFWFACCCCGSFIDAIVDVIVLLTMLFLCCVFVDNIVSCRSVASLLSVVVAAALSMKLLCSLVSLLCFYAHVVTCLGGWLVFFFGLPVVVGQIISSHGFHVPNFGPHVVLHGYSADGRASSQATARSSKAVSSASCFSVGLSYTPKKGDLVWHA